MKQKFKNVQSTRQQPTNARYTRKMFMKIEDVKNNSYLDQTGEMTCR